MNTAREKVRNELLCDGLIDWVSLSEVNSRVLKHNPTASPSAVQKETMAVIHSLVSEGLFELGSRSDDDDRFVASDEPLETSMQRIYDAYVKHNDQRLGWVYRFWFNLSDKGKSVALSSEKGRQIAREEEERVRALRKINDAGRA
jgi:hypothetical protein